MERGTGVEPVRRPWKGRVIPLDQPRDIGGYHSIEKEARHSTGFSLLWVRAFDVRIDPRFHVRWEDWRYPQWCLRLRCDTRSVQTPEDVARDRERKTSAGCQIAESTRGFVKPDPDGYGDTVDAVGLTGDAGVCEPVTGSRLTQQRNFMQRLHSSGGTGWQPHRSA